MNKVAVLLVDDNATFLHHATRFIEQVPRLHVAGTARNSREATDQAQALQPDVVLLDVSMPGQSGFDSIQLLKRDVPNVRIIMLTTLDDVAYREHAFRLGADGFVSKADMTTTLIPEIYRVVGWNLAGEPAHPPGSRTGS